MKKRFLIQLLVSLVAVFITASALFFVICKGLRNTKRDTIGKFNYLISDTTYYNTVFFGSSRAHTHLNPALFDSLVRSNSFNAGQDGIRIAEMDLIIQKFVKAHGAPKTIFINMDESTITTEKKVWYYPQYFPYVNDPAFNGLIKLEPRLYLAKYLPAAALTYFDDPLKNLGLQGAVKHGGKYDIPLKGFEPLGPHQFETDPSAPDANFEMDPKAWPYFEHMLAFCRDNNINTYLIMAPIYNYAFTGPSVVAFVNRLHQMQPKYGFKLINLGSDARFKARDLYADQLHLNRTGADIYTSALADEFLKR